MSLLAIQSFAEVAIDKEGWSVNLSSEKENSHAFL